MFQGIVSFTMRNIKINALSLALFVLRFSGLNQLNVTCPQGWIRLHRGCYLFKREEMNWIEASKYCNSKQGSLIVIQSFMEKKIITDHLKSFPKTFWYGGFKKESGIWRTVNGETLPIHMKSDSNRCKATRRGNDCGLLNLRGSDLKFRCISCDRKIFFICEYHNIQLRPSTNPTTPLLVTADSVTLSSTHATVLARSTSERSVIKERYLSTQYPSLISNTMPYYDVNVTNISPISNNKSTENGRKELVTESVLRYTSGIGSMPTKKKSNDRQDDIEGEDVTTIEVTSPREMKIESSSSDQTYLTEPYPPFDVAPHFEDEIKIEREEEKEGRLNTKDNKNKNKKEKARDTDGVIVGNEQRNTGLHGDQKSRLQVGNIWAGNMDASICVEHEFKITCGWEMDIIFSRPLSSMEIWNSTIRSTVATLDGGARVTVTSRIWADSHQDGDCTRFIAFYDGLESPEVTAHFTRVCRDGRFSDVGHDGQIEDNADYRVQIESSWNTGMTGEICLFHTTNITCGFDAEIIISPPISELEVYSMSLIGQEESSTGIRYQLSNLIGRGAQPDNPACHKFLVRHKENDGPKIIKGHYTRLCHEGEFTTNLRGRRPAGR